MASTILVTGATGTVGAELVKALANRGVTVRAGVHSIIKGDRLKHLNPDVQLVEIDYRKPETLAVALTGVERVFLLPPPTPDQIELSRSLVEVAKQVGVRQLVQLSAAGAGRDAHITIDQRHREIEQLVADSGLTYATLRPEGFMQNFVHQHCATIRDEGKFYLPLSDAQVAYIDVRDIAAAAATLLTADPAAHAGQAYHLTGPAALSGQQVAEALSQATGREVTYVPVAEEAARAAMQELPAERVEELLALYADYRAGHAAAISHEGAALLGRAPHTIQQFADDYQAQFQPEA
ncbi:NmrA family NAD(P)-binding protein [Hymenobacter aerilatus]|uniref:NmrA family NAD(P)-binding protein n=1 Tax=Hymenobacter aerilatus TaxID=2932251 RepID=A0A8T9SZ66_9BACT|nr:NmrA family NAD(P)-binding protein [Hymenobacter aerilatus]UOR05530.1 NmrA family NAD(P)-binding protein [Hymenobacter aerilatus]